MGRRHKRQSGNRYLITWVILAVAAFALQRIAASHPALAERVYARGIFPAIGRALSVVAGLFPFSLTELAVWALVPVGLLWMAATWRAMRTAPAPSVLGRRLAGLVGWFCAVYVGFVLLWGLNYCRQPFATVANLPTAPTSVDELVGLCRYLVDRTNTLRLTVHEDANGVMRLENGIPDALRRAQAGYDRAAAQYPFLQGRYSPPKGVLSSPLWSYTAIAGVYFPFTGEANVNTAMPPSAIPAAATHEMAHQRGFAREDEANYIGYLAARLNPDSDFQYSGYLSALVNALSALKPYAPERYTELLKLLSSGVRRDLANENAFWRKYEGPVADVSDKVNDSYLKANMQSEGVRSYGRMVDLLLAEFRAEGGR